MHLILKLQEMHFSKGKLNFERIRDWDTNIRGDFNETMNQIDRKSASRKNTKPQQVSSLKTLIKSSKLTDIRRDLNENVQQFTWRRND